MSIISSLLRLFNFATAMTVTAVIFILGILAVVGIQQSWIAVTGRPVFVCGVGSAFIIILGVGIGVGEFFGSSRSRLTGIVGIALALAGSILFLVVRELFLVVQ